MFCVKCGKELQEQWKACPYCGNDLNNSIMGQTQEKKISDASRLGMVKGVLGIMVVLLLATLSLYWAKNAKEDVQLSYEIYTDAENGLLYSNVEGQITNEKGDVISNYSGYSITENGYVSDGECCLEGLAVNEKGKLYVFVPGEMITEESYKTKEEEQVKIQTYSDDEIIDRTSQKVKERLSSGYSAADSLYHSFSVDSAFVSYDAITGTYTCNMTVTYSTNVFDFYGTSSSSYDVIATYSDMNSALVATGFSMF